MNPWKMTMRSWVIMLRGGVEDINPPGTMMTILNHLGHDDQEDIICRYV